jgi:hypothetical protein
MQEEQVNKLGTAGFQRFVLKAAPYGVLLFIFFIYAAPTSKLANIGFYLVVLLPMVLAAPLLIKDTEYVSYIRPFIIIITAWLLLMVIGLDAEWGMFGKKLRHAFYVLVFISAIYFTLSSRLVSVNKIIAYIFWLTVAYSIVSMAIYYGWYGRSFSARLIPVLRLDSPIFVADILSVFGVSLIYLMFQKESYLQVLVTLAVILSLQYFYNARSALVGLCFGLFIMLFLSNVKHKKVILLVTFILLVSYVAVSAYYGNLLNRGVSYRIDIWLSGIEKALDCNLWFGCGFGDDRGVVIDDGLVFQHAHNIFIVHLINTGIVGALGLLIPLAYILVKGWQVKSAMSFGLFAGIITLFFDGNELITNPDALWLIFWLPVAQVYWQIKLNEEELLGHS